MSDRNVVDFVTRMNKIKEEAPKAEDCYFPTEMDVQTFLMVLDFIRKLSVSRTGKIQFSEDYLKIALTHYTDIGDVNDYGVTQVSAFHQEVDMGFNFVIDPITEEQASLQDVSNDLLDGLEGLVLWMSGEE